MTTTKKAASSPRKTAEAGKTRTPAEALAELADTLKAPAPKAEETTTQSAEDAAGTVIAPEPGKATASGQTGVVNPAEPHESGAGNKAAEAMPAGQFAGGSPTPATTTEQ